MLECKNVSIRYGKTVVLEDLSFTAAPGEITVLLGKNGSGKSTLLRAMCGGVPYTGTICAEGEDLRQLRAGARARRLSLMPQLLPSPGVTVRELVSFGRQPYTGFSGILSRADREKVGDVLQKTGLLPFADRPVGRLSGGERQKAYFAMLLAGDAPNLLLDEPAAHLDAEYTGALCRFLSEERARGKTVLAVLHDINRALQLADRVLVLSDGRLVFNGAPADFAKGPLPSELFGLERLYVTPEAPQNTSGSHAQTTQSTPGNPPCDQCPSPNAPTPWQIFFR